MKEKFPLLNLIKTIFLSLWGYSFNEARSDSTPPHTPAACMHGPLNSFKAAGSEISLLWLKGSVPEGPKDMS